MSRRIGKQRNLKSLSHLRILLVLAVGLGFALCAVMGLAATTPASGTLSPSNPSIQFQGGPFPVSNPSSPIGATPPVCVDQTCGVFALAINIPTGDTNQYNVKVSVRWTDSGTATTQGATSSDFDVFVYQPSGPTGTSAGSQGPNANPQELQFTAATGNYTVYVVPYDVAPDVPFNATVTINKVDANPAATPTPPPPPPGTPLFNAYLSPQGVGDGAGEPSIGSNWKTGKVLYYGGFLSYMLRVTFDDTVAPARALWEQKDVLLAATPRALGDPILFTDRETGRTFISQLEGGTKQNTMDITDDDGETLQVSIGSGINSGVDHQTLGGGPFAPGLSSLNSYKNAVYYCAQDDAAANCAISLDGGVTFGPAVPMYTLVQCGGIHGHIKIAPDGTAYLPNKGCGGKQAVVVSENNGINWEVREVPGSTTGQWDPSVGVATDGTVYFGYDAADGHARVQVSHDKGKTWTQPYDVGAQLGINNIIFSAVVAGDPDRAAFAFIGTTTGGNYNASDFKGAWYMFVASTLDGGQNWTTVNATPGDPVQRGRVCTDGTTCAAPGGGGDTRNLLDFMDATIDEKGRVLVGYADGCITSGCIQGDKNGDGTVDTQDNDFASKAAIVRQTDGKRMFARFDVIGPVILAPTPQNDAAEAHENRSVDIDVLANDTDPNGQSLTISAVTQGANGSVVNNGNNVTYTPYHNFSGDDAFTYTVRNDSGLTNTATVRVSVAPDCAPTATGRFFDNVEGANPGYSVSNNRTTGGWAQTSDRTAHSPGKAWVVGDEQPGLPQGTQKDASLTLPAQDLTSTSVMTFWHNYDFARFLASTPATAYQSGGVIEISADGSNWIDLGGFITTGGYNGKVSDTAMNPLKGRPAFVGSSDGDTGLGRIDAMKKVTVNLGAAIQAKYGATQLRGAKIRFRLGGTFQLLIGGIQGTGWSVDDIEVANTLQPGKCNRPPTAVNDTATTTQNTPVRINVSENDSDPDFDALTVTSVGPPAHGSVNIVNSNTVNYAPGTNYVGNDSFTYTISDGHGGTATATVNVNVTP
ncbi:MAG: hypothetical protein QOD00_519 [Blastocatellia bacterium]|nr:hypothetical protein [Blastocatellia bacterium]